MEKRSIEACIISARGLKRSNPLCKLRTLCVAWINPEHKYCSNIDKIGNTHPTWNMKFSCILDARELEEDPELASLHVEVHSQEPLFHYSKLECSATIPLKEFVAQSNNADEDYTESASFQLRTPSGKARGMVDVWIRVGRRFDPQAPYDQGYSTNGISSEDSGEPVTAYPADLTPSMPSGRPDNFPPPKFPYTYPLEETPASVPAPAPAQGPSRPPRNSYYPRPPPVRPPMASQPVPPFMGSWPTENYIGLPGSRPAGNNYAGAGQHQGLGLGAGVLAGAAAGGLMFGLDGTPLQNGLGDSIMSQFHGGSLSISSDPFFSM